MSAAQPNPSQRIPEELDDQTLETLLVAFHSGNDDAEQRLWSYARARARSRVARKGPGGAAGQRATSDVAQESMLRAFVALHTFGERGRGVGFFNAWLDTITDNTARGIHRSGKRLKRTAPAPDSMEAARLRSPRPRTPSYEAQVLELAGQIATLLAEYPEEYRALRLYVEGCTFPEIARVMGRTEAYAWAKFKSARARVRKALGADMHPSTL